MFFSRIKYGSFAQEKLFYASSDALLTTPFMEDFYTTNVIFSKRPFSFDEFVCEYCSCIAHCAAVHDKKFRHKSRL